MSSLLNNRRVHGAIQVSISWSLPIELQNNKKGSKTKYKTDDLNDNTLLMDALNTEERELGDSGSDSDSDSELNITQRNEFTQGKRSGNEFMFNEQESVHTNLSSSEQHHHHSSLKKKSLSEQFLIPQEKLELETGQLVGLRSKQDRPWQQSMGHKPSSWPLPPFTRESGFMHTLPHLNKIDPLDYRDASLLRFRKQGQGHSQASGVVHHHRYGTLNGTSNRAPVFGGGGGGNVFGGPSQHRGFGGMKDDLLIHTSDDDDDDEMMNDKDGGNGLKNKTKPKKNGSRNQNHHSNHLQTNTKAYNCRKNEIVAGLFAPSTLGRNYHGTTISTIDIAAAKQLLKNSSTSTSLALANITEAVTSKHPYLHPSASSSSSSMMKSLVNPENFLEPSRHVLLKLRRSMPFSPVFLEQPIPLDEKEILKNDNYRQLLKEVGWLVTPKEYEQSLKEDLATLQLEQQEIDMKNNKDDDDDEEEDDAYNNEEKKKHKKKNIKKTLASTLNQTLNHEGGDEDDGSGGLNMYDISSIHHMLGLEYMVALQLGPMPHPTYVYHDDHAGHGGGGSGGLHKDLTIASRYTKSYRKHASVLLSHPQLGSSPFENKTSTSSHQNVSGGDGDNSMTVSKTKTTHKHLGDKPYFSSNQLSSLRSALLVDLINHYRSLKQRNGGIGSNPGYLQNSGSMNRFIANKPNADIESIVQEFEIEVEFDMFDMFELDNLLPSPHRRLRPPISSTSSTHKIKHNEIQSNQPNSSTNENNGNNGHHSPTQTSPTTSSPQPQPSSSSSSAAQSPNMPGNSSSGSSSGFLKQADPGPDKVIIQIIQAENIPYKRNSNHNRDNHLKNNDSINNLESNQFNHNSKYHSKSKSARSSFNDRSSLDGSSGWEAAVMLLSEDNHADIEPSLLEEKNKPHVCVYATLRGRCERNTSTDQSFSGRNPIWKETFVLPYLHGSNQINLNHVLASSKLKKSELFEGPWEEEELVLTLFDMVDEEENSWRSMKKEKRYLGRCVIPLSAAIHGRLECFLRVETPEINVDYTFENPQLLDRGNSKQISRRNWSSTQQDNNNDDGLLNNSASSYGRRASNALSGLFSNTTSTFTNNEGGGKNNDGNEDGQDEEDDDVIDNDDVNDLSIMDAFPPSDCRVKTMKRRANERMMLRISLVLDPQPIGHVLHHKPQHFHHAHDNHNRRSNSSSGGGGVDDDDNDEDDIPAWGDDADLTSSKKHHGHSHTLFGAATHQHTLLHVNKFQHLNKQSNIHHQIHSYCNIWVKNIKKLISSQSHPLNRLFLCYTKQLNGKEVLITQCLLKQGIKPPNQSYFPLSKEEDNEEDNDKNLSRRSKRKHKLDNKIKEGEENDNEEEKENDNKNDNKKERKEMATLSQVCRYVSLLPFASSSYELKQLSLWCSCAEFLEMGIGGGGEHATLLWHFLVYIQNEKIKKNQKKSSQASSSHSKHRIVLWDYYLLFGRDVIGEPSWNVLALESIHSSIQYYDYQQFHRSRKGVIYDPHSGEVFNITDHRAPITDIGCLISSENIFANVEVNGKPSDLARINGFDLFDIKKWRSLFPHTNPHLYPSSTTTTTNQSTTSDRPTASGSGTASSSLSHIMPSTGLFMNFFKETNQFAEEAANMVAKLGSIQTPILDYGMTVDADECIDIAQRIQDRLRDAITEWRTDGQTGRDHRAYPVFAPDLRAKALLRDLERKKCGYMLPSSSNNNVQSQKLSKSQRRATSSQSYKEDNRVNSRGVSSHNVADLVVDSGQRSLHGVALNFALTDMITIEERLKETAIHDTSANDVLFLLAVHVAPFPNGLFSVWVFYGNMPRNN